MHILCTLKFLLYWKLLMFSTLTKPFRLIYYHKWHNIFSGNLLLKRKRNDKLILNYICLVWYYLTLTFSILKSALKLKNWILVCRNKTVIVIMTVFPFNSSHSNNTWQCMSLLHLEIIQFRSILLQQRVTFTLLKLTIYSNCYQNCAISKKLFNTFLHLYII